MNIRFSLQAVIGVLLVAGIAAFAVTPTLVQVGEIQAAFRMSIIGGALLVVGVPSAVFGLVVRRYLELHSVR